LTPRVTLSFDNGPTPGITEQVLDILAREDIKATFFVIGRKLREPGAAALMRRAHAKGHWIGNHTLSHSIPFGEQPSAAFAREELDTTRALIGACAGAEKLFRPYGREGRIGPHLFSHAAAQHLLDQHYRAILWNTVPGDWRDPDGWLDVCLHQVAQRDWSVIVLHDIANGCLPHLPALIAHLKAQDVRFEQDFPRDVELLRAGRLIGLNEGLIGDGTQGLCTRRSSA
jgi:peptidoglycan/xylan/chitin deacetylase (PgdA/CDA1 family)